MLQVAATDCGPSALAMLLAASGRAVPVARLRAHLDVGRDGLSLRDLRDAAQEFGLRCRAIALPALRQDATRLRAVQPLGQLGDEVARLGDLQGRPELGVGGLRVA
ncbi:cysteine peptidase family C39 domain-containing protein, partial [Micromonospora carbonacea]|uniref:cysteine peptidase family C39 domain-containing protein n=1 Tax=Micromonospora carbonacea TaxID=47853 RepID=UPI003F4D637D